MFSLLIAISLAHAGELDATLFGKPFQPKAAVGITTPSQPGTLSVLLMTPALSCAELIALQNGPSPKPSVETTMLITSFNEPAPGVTASVIIGASDAGFSAVSGPATLGAVPKAAGTTGTLTLDLHAPAPAESTSKKPKKGKKSAADHVVGEVTYTMCTDLAERPSLANLSFEPLTLPLGFMQDLEAGAPPRVTLSAQVPTGWEKRTNTFGQPAWVAPDGQTTLTFTIQTPDEDFLEARKEQLRRQVDAFQTAATTGKLELEQSPNPATYIAQWSNRWSDTPATFHLEVYRYEPSWKYVFRCDAQAPETQAKEAFAALTEACATMTIAP